MARVADPGARDLLQSLQARRSAEAAEKAAARLLASIEADGARPVSPSHGEAMRRHGGTLHQIGGRALVRLTFNRLCAVAPERASRRFDILGRAWGELLSKEGRP